MQSQKTYMTQDILIVGLKHFLNEESIAYLLNTLTPEHEISLVLAEDNPVDKNAIQVWMPFSEDGLKKNMQIGFVSSDYTDLIRYNYPDARTMIVAGAHRNEESDSTFYITMDLDYLGVNYPESHLDNTPIAGVAIPYLNHDYQLSLQQTKHILEVLTLSLDGKKVSSGLVHDVLRAAEEFEQIYGQSLNGEEQAAYFQLVMLIESVMTYMPKELVDLQLALSELRAMRKRFAEEEDRYLQVMTSEMNMVKVFGKPFFTQVQQAIKKGLSTQAQEIAKNEEWLRQLPDNLYLWIDNEKELAVRLYYEKFAVEDLYAIYLHLVYRDLLCPKGKLPIEEALLKHRIQSFHFWGYQCTTYEERVAATAAWKEAFKVKQWVSQLAMVIKQQRKHHILRDDLYPLNLLAEEMSGILNKEVKPNSLQRHFKGEKFSIKDDYMFDNYKRPPIK